MTLRFQQDANQLKSNSPFLLSDNKYINEFVFCWLMAIVRIILGFYLVFIIPSLRKGRCVSASNKAN